MQLIPIEIMFLLVEFRITLYYFYIFIFYTFNLKYTICI